MDLPPFYGPGRPVYGHRGRYPDTRPLYGPLGPFIDLSAVLWATRLLHRPSSHLIYLSDILSMSQPGYGLPAGL